MSTIIAITCTIFFNSAWLGIHIDSKVYRVSSKAACHDKAAIVHGTPSIDVYYDTTADHLQLDAMCGKDGKDCEEVK